MSRLIQHYQTSFVIQNDTQAWENKIYQAQYLIGEWIKNHERKRFREMKRDKRASFLIDSNFTRRSSYSSKFSWCKTDYCLEEGALAWAVQYTHRDSQIRDVFWVSDIGLRAFSETGRLIVSVKICYKVTTEFSLTGQRLFEPDVSIPWCVEALLESFDGSKFLSGEKDVTEGIGRAITISTPAQAEELRAYIQSQERKLAVVLLHGETDDAYNEARYLARNLFAKALVYIIPYKIELKKTLGLRLDFNECVFVPPFVVYDVDLAKKLRYFVTSKEVVKERRQIILHSWLGIHPINERGAVADIDNVRLLIRRAQFFRLEGVIQRSVPADKFEQMKTELKEMSGLFELSENEKKELENRVGELEERNLDLEIAKQDMEEAHATEVYNLKATHDSISRKSVGDVLLLPREYPDSFIALRSFAPFYRHLVFTDTAWDPAIAYRNFKDFGVVWEMLHDLDQKLWNIVFVTRGDIEREFDGSTVYEYARGEGKQTMNDSRLARLRRFEFEGKVYEMWAHLKYGNRPGKQLRIHFAIDHEKRRIIVGYIGEHMDNATTRTIH